MKEIALNLSERKIYSYQHIDTPSRAYIPTIAFGVTATMFAIAFAALMPPGLVPKPFLGMTLMICVAVGGYIGGRHTTDGWQAGMKIGLLTSALNLIALGSLLAGDSHNAVKPSAILYIPGFLLFGVILGTLGGFLGSLSHRQPKTLNWISIFIYVTAGATFLMLWVGGIVTSKQAGLAVVDWPNTFGYNMFLYPLSRMTGGIFYEHSHRLFGSLLGLMVIALVVLLWRSEDREPVRKLAIALLPLVIVQGIIGGLRVTGGFTLSSAPEDMSPSSTLAILHGVLGQIFFALVVALAVLSSGTWRSNFKPIETDRAPTERFLSKVLIGILVVQLFIGAILRHIVSGRLIHITLGVMAVVIAVVLGARTWGLYQNCRILYYWGLILLGLAGFQLLSGLSAFIAVGVMAGFQPQTVDVVLTSLHQLAGALLLGCAVSLMLLTHRLIEPLQKTT